MHRSLATLAGAAALALVTVTASAQQQPAAPGPSRIPRGDWCVGYHQDHDAGSDDPVCEHRYRLHRSEGHQRRFFQEQEGKYGEATDTTKPKKD
jgi:invasion protein IalB